MSKKKNVSWEVTKFGLRMVVFALPLIVNALTDAGLTEWAALASSVLALADKYIHLTPNDSRGLVPF